MKLPILLITGLMLFYPAAGFAQSVEGVPVSYTHLTLPTNSRV